MAIDVLLFNDGKLRSIKAPLIDLDSTLVAVSYKTTLLNSILR